MSGIKWMKEHVRLWVQTVAALLTNGNLQGFLDGTIYKGVGKKFCVPGLNCYSCPGAWGACPIGALQAVVSSRNYIVSFYVSGFLLAVGALGGRFVCGWLCPFGWVQDLIYRAPGIKKMKALWGERWLRLLKYAVLFLLVIALPVFITTEAGVGVPWFCKTLCPSGTLGGGVPLLTANAELRQAAGWLFVWKMAVLLGLLALALKLFRPFCRYLCPLGAIYGFLNPVALYRYEIDRDECTRCGACRRACHMDIPVYEKPNSRECIRCEQCRNACPQGAIGCVGTVKQKSEARNV